MPASFGGSRGPTASRLSQLVRGALRGKQRPKEQLSVCLGRSTAWILEEDFSRGPFFQVSTMLKGGCSTLDYLVGLALLNSVGLPKSV